MSAVAPPGLRSLAEHIPPGQFGRYLLVGAANTAFAYGTYALFTYLLQGVMPASYLAGSVLSSLLNITVSFLGYKWFVFKIRGNHLQAWGRCVVVYGSTIMLGLVLLPPLVILVESVTRDPRIAPYVAGAVVLGVQAVLSFLGHRNFTFRNVLEPKGDGRVS